jgi:hypothetical protein
MDTITGNQYLDLALLLLINVVLAAKLIQVMVRTKREIDASPFAEGPIDPNWECKPHAWETVDLVLGGNSKRTLFCDGCGYISGTKAYLKASFVENLRLQRVLIKEYQDNREQLIMDFSQSLLELTDTGKPLLEPVSRMADKLVKDAWTLEQTFLIEKEGLAKHGNSRKPK